MNIKFLYLYRDRANYKNHNEIIFSNNNAFSLDAIKAKIISCLISGEFFYANEFGVPDMHFSKWDNEYDHLWHEFIDVEETEETSNTDKDIDDFLAHIKSTN